LCPRNGTIRFDAWQSRVTTHFVGAGVIQGQVGPETSNNIIKKGLALRPKQSGSVVASTGY
jgi:hypothetical protein